MLQTHPVGPTTDRTTVPLRDRIRAFRTPAAWAWVAPVLIWVLGSAMAWIRLTPPTRNTVWAEDGKLFLDEYFDLGAAGSLFHNYAGYLHVVPRILVAIAVHAAPIDRYAVTISALCCLVSGAVGAAVFILTRDLVRSPAVRLLLALVPTLLPLGPMEISGNVANLHSYLLFLAPFVLLAEVRSWRRGIVLGVVGLLSGLTEIQILMFAPLAFVGLRNRRRWVVLAGFAIGLAAQVVTTLTHPRVATNHHKNSAADLAIGYLIQAVGGSWTWSMPTIGVKIAHHGLVIVILPAIVVLLVVVAGFWLGFARQRFALATMLWGSALVWGASVYLNPSPAFAFASFTPSQFTTIWTFRYGAASSMFVIAAVLFAVDGILNRRGLARRIVAVVVMLAVVWVFVANFSMDKSNREQGPIWNQQVDQSEQMCETHMDENAVIQTAPGPQWATTVPCAVIDPR